MLLDMLEYQFQFHQIYMNYGELCFSTKVYLFNKIFPVFSAQVIIFVLALIINLL